jgi:biopolymer transport protein ExbD
MKFKTSLKPLTAFSHSSLTDVVMLLLIFFLLTSQFVIHTGVKVKLPGAKNNEQVPPSKFVVALTSDGIIYLGGEQISIFDLPAKLNILKSTSEENNLIIKADKVVPIELVIRVIDAAKGVGIDKFTIETEKEKL